MEKLSLDERVKMLKELDDDLRNEIIDEMKKMLDDEEQPQKLKDNIKELFEEYGQV